MSEDKLDQALTQWVTVGLVWVAGVLIVGQAAHIVTVLRDPKAVRDGQYALSIAGSMGVGWIAGCLPGLMTLWLVNKRPIFWKTAARLAWGYVLAMVLLRLGTELVRLGRPQLGLLWFYLLMLPLSLMAVPESFGYLGALILGFCMLVPLTLLLRYTFVRQKRITEGKVLATKGTG